MSEEPDALKEWLRGCLQEIVAEWQPSNADYVNFSSSVLQQLDQLTTEVHKARDEMKEMIKTSKKLIDFALENRGYAKL